MADALEQTKNLFSVDDFNEDDISDKSKVISALENPFGEFRPKEEIIEKAKATGTGLLTGTLGIPSDAATLASAVSSGMAKYADSPTAMMLKDVLKKAEKDVGRPAFDKWFTDTTGLESNPENVDQLVGEVLSPTGAFLAPVKTLKNIFAPLKKGVTDFFDKMPPPDSGLAVETAGVGQLEQTKNLLDKENISKPIETNIPPLPSADELANKPTINPTIIGTQTETGKKAEAIYDDLVAKGVTDPKEIFKKTGGGYVGRDGKFRFDLDDRDAKLKVNPDELEFDIDYENMSSWKGMTADDIRVLSQYHELETKTTTLGKVLDFDDLYKQYYKSINVVGGYGKSYPALRNVKVVFNYGEPPERTLGSYSPAEDRIILHMKNLINPFRKGFDSYSKAQEQEDYIMSTLIHEVQHAVQRREGFISGANSDDTKDIVLDAINEDGAYKLPLGSDKKEITTPYMSGISRYNTDSAYNAYLEADILSKAIKNNTNTDKFINLADNISDNIPDFTGDRKIEFLRNYEILLDSKNRLNSYIKKGISAKNKEDLVSLTMDILPSDFTKAKNAFGFKDKDTFANFVFEDLKSLDDLKGFVDRAYNRARVNINLDDKSLAKLEAEQARRLKNDEALLNFKGEVDREAKRLYLDEYGEMEARLVEQRYARRQELRRDPMLLTDEQITEKMLEDTGDIFKEPDKYGRTTKILGGFKKGQTSIPTNNINTVYESANILETTPIKNNPALQRISEIAKLQDGPLGSRTPMDKDGLPKNLLRDKDGKPLVLYYGDMGQVYDPKTHTYTSSDIPGKLTNKFEPSGRTYTTDKKVGNFVTPNPVFASGYASKEGGSVIPVYLIADKVSNIKARSFSDIDKAGGDAKRGEVFIGDVGYDSAPPVKLVNGREVTDLELRDESIKKYGTEQYTFNRGTQVFSAITGERLTELPTINQNIRNKLLKLTQKEEDITLKNMSPEEQIKYKAEKTYTEDFIDQPDFVEDMFKLNRKGDIERNERKRNLAKGGDMKKQMEMFEDGGLKQEGGTIDPVSGNDVPPGSTQEEVRDDIPAQLSEGEFVFPADVVRYIGLEKLMRLRQEAKQGLKMMEEMGQMGNSEEATMPDDLPFDETDLDIEDEEEYNNDTQEMNQGGMVRVGGMEIPRPIIAGQQMAEGGVVKAQSGTFVNPGTGVTTIPSQFAGQNLPSYNPNQTYQAFTRPSYTVPTIPGQTTGGYRPVFYGKPPADSKGITTPTFENLLGRNPGQYDEFREYRNDAGFTLRIPFRNGQPIYPIPEGFRFVDPEKEETETTTTQTTQTGTTQVSGDGGDNTGAKVGTTMVGKTGIGVTDKSLTENQKASMITSAIDKATDKGMLGKALGVLGTSMVPGIGLTGALAGQQLGFDPMAPDRTEIDDILGQFGYDAKSANAALNDPMAAIGLTPEQAANMANSMSITELSSPAAQEAIAQGIYGMSKAEVTSMLGVPANTTLGIKGYNPGNIDPTTGATYSINGQATDDQGNVAYSSFSSFSNAMSASSKSGYYGSEKQAEKDAAKGNKKAKAFLNALNAERQADKDKEAADRGGTGALGGIGDLGSGYGIGESTGTGSQSMGIESDVAGIGTGTGSGATAGGATDPSGDLGSQESVDSNESVSGDTPGASEGATGGIGDYNTGGLAGKKKPKVKRMKRGGLASKK